MYNVLRGKCDRDRKSEEPPLAAKKSNPSAAGTGKKVALSERIQAALITKADLTEDQCGHIWKEVNKEATN